MPRHAVPCRAMLCHAGAMPCHAMHAVPCWKHHAVPCCAMPCYAALCQSCLQCRCRAMPLCRFMPFHAGHAVQCRYRAIPCHTVPCRPQWSPLSLESTKSKYSRENGCTKRAMTAHAGLQPPRATYLHVTSPNAVDTTLSPLRCTMPVLLPAEGGKDVPEPQRFIRCC